MRCRLGALMMRGKQGVKNDAKTACSHRHLRRYPSRNDHPNSAIAVFPGVTVNHESPAAAPLLIDVSIAWLDAEQHLRLYSTRAAGNGQLENWNSKMSIFSTLTRYAVVGTVALGGMSAMIASGEARTFTEDEFINRDRCFVAERIPALVEYNTRGELVQNSSRSWVGNPQVSGSLVVDQHNDAVFLQTRRVLEDQHVTLIPVPC